MNERDLGFVRRFPGHCCNVAVRKGEEVPCDKVAVAVRIDTDDGHPYPVCAYHARGDMVPLAELLAARHGGES